MGMGTLGKTSMRCRWCGKTLPEGAHWRFCSPLCKKQHWLWFQRGIAPKPPKGGVMDEKA